MDDLQVSTAALAEDLRGAGLTPEIAADGVRVVLPAGYRVVSATESMAEVEVWAVSVAHLGDITPLRSSWDTQTTTMACEGNEWRLVAVRSQEGPVPELALQGDGQLDSTLGTIASFTELDHEP